MIKTFRGILADGGQQVIRLSTKKGKIGYRIVKFELFANNPGASTYESVVKIYKVFQSTIDGSVDFSDGNLLAASYLEGNTSNYYIDGITTIFDREIFNQDIHITHIEHVATATCNYYIELETINMSDNAAAVSTLRDIRLNPQVGA